MHTVFPNLKIQKSSTLDTYFKLKFNNWSIIFGLAENKSEMISLSDWFSIR